jgi:hypothetical protein
MKLISLVSRVAVVASVWLLLGSGGYASVIAPWLPLPAVDNGHRSSLRARATMVDGRSRAITIQGVGCTESICSRVRATSSTADSVWLDGLASIHSIHAISHDPNGPVKATFTFKNGTERQASIVQVNRVLYVDGRFGRTEKLDLGGLTKIDFE